MFRFPGNYSALQCVLVAVVSLSWRAGAGNMFRLVGMVRMAYVRMAGGRAGSSVSFAPALIQTCNLIKVVGTRSWRN